LSKGKKKSVSAESIQKFDELIAKRFNKSRFITSEPCIDKSFSGRKFYASYQVLEEHLNEERIVGLGVAGETGNKYSSIILADLDNPEIEWELYLKIHEQLHGEPYPTFTFQNKTNGHIYGVDLLDRTINSEKLKAYSKLYNLSGEGFESQIDIRSVGGKMTRLPFGYGYQWVKPNSSYSLFPGESPSSKDGQLGVAYRLYEQGSLSVTNTSELLQALRNSTIQNKAIQEFGYAYEKQTKIFSVGGELWDRVDQHLTLGLTGKGTRNRAVGDLVLMCIHRGYTESETIGFILQQWLPKKHNGQSKDWDNGRIEQIRAEVLAYYRKASATFDESKAKRPPAELTPEEQQTLYDILDKPAYWKLKPRQRDKVYKLLAHIHQLYRTTSRKGIVRISHTLFDLWGYYQKKGRFNAVSWLISQRYIKPRYPRSYTNVCQSYILLYLKTSPRILKSTETKGGFSSENLNKVCEPETLERAEENGSENSSESLWSYLRQESVARNNGGKQAGSRRATGGRSIKKVKL